MHLAEACFTTCRSVLKVFACGQIPWFFYTYSLFGWTNAWSCWDGLVRLRAPELLLTRLHHHYDSYKHELSGTMSKWMKHEGHGGDGGSFVFVLGISMENKHGLSFVAIPQLMMLLWWTTLNRCYQWSLASRLLGTRCREPDGLGSLSGEGILCRDLDHNWNHCHDVLRAGYRGRKSNRKNNKTWSSGFKKTSKTKHEFNKLWRKLFEHFGRTSRRRPVWVPLRRPRSTSSKIGCYLFMPLRGWPCANFAPEC